MPVTPATQQGSARDGLSSDAEAANPGASSNLPLQFDEKTFSNKYALDTSNLSYRFSYLSKKEEQAIVFAQGLAKINISGLENGKQGDLALAILEAGIVKFEGVAKALTLKPGANQLQLVLKAVDAAVASTDLTINVTIDDGTPATTNTSFEQTVKPILDRHCTECHHQGFSFGDFTVYPFASAGMEERIIKRIENGTMPPSPRSKVSQADLSAIKLWRSGN